MAGELNRYTRAVHLVLFDIDGTLITGKGMGRLALERAFAEVFQLRPEQFPAVRDVHFAGSTDPVILADMAAACEVTADRLQRDRHALETAYYRHLRITVSETADKSVCPGALDVVQRLAEHPRLLLGLLTGNFEQGARIKLEPFGLNPHFRFGAFGGDAEGRTAIAAHALALARARTGVPIPPEHAVLIGDTVDDVTAAKGNGFLSVAVCTGWSPPERLRSAGADLVVPDLTPGHGFEAWLSERWALAEEAGSV
jgi:phosphoglycolate phosphatase-like HAD superfamily hydrolase